jgi:RNA polymerase sigma factor (sigma-70 family)
MNPEQIFVEALARYERPLFAYARGITGETESARDAVQETFLRLSQQDLAVLAPRLAPWLFLVCRRCALDFRRKAATHPVIHPEQEEAVAEDPTPCEQAARAEEAEQLRALVGKLPPRQREVVQLRFEGGLSYKEMSEVLRISVSQVGVQLHHALQTLRSSWFRTTGSTRPALPL